MSLDTLRTLWDITSRKKTMFGVASSSKKNFGLRGSSGVLERSELGIDLSSFFISDANGISSRLLRIKKDIVVDS